MIGFISGNSDGRDTLFLRLRPGIQLVREGESIYVVGDKVLKISAPEAYVFHTLELLESASSMSFAELSREVGEAKLSSLVEQLFELDLIQLKDTPFRERPSNCTEGYFDAVLSQPDRLEHLRELDIAVLGVGAMGGELARHLVASGVRRLTLIDADTVDASNLNRQYLYTLEDLGRSKVEAAREALSRLAGELDIRLKDTYVDDLATLRQLGIEGADAVVCCADTPNEIESLVSRFAHESGSLFATASLGLHVGTWGPIIEPESRVTWHQWCARHHNEILQDALVPLGASFGPTNSIVAGALARDLLHVLLGDDAVSLGARVVLDFRDFSAQCMPLDGSEPAEEMG